MLDRDAVEHNSHDVFYRSVLGALEAGSKVRLGIRIRTEERIKQILLRFWRDRVGEKLVQLTTKDTRESGDYFYSIECEMPEKGCLLWYYFIINTEQGTCYYGNNPEQLGGEGALYETVPPSYQITVYNKGARTPDWFKHSVMYQIFPDRFYRSGNAMKEKRGAVYHASWEDDPCYYKDPDTKEIVAYDFFGGNLKGIEEKLDYLKELGISTIYLNPVFESESNHHYDTGDYHKIDPILGTEEDFRHLMEAGKKKGIRFIIDGVFSHTGSNSRYFNASGEYDTVGAYQSQKSPYYGWYSFRSWPRDYDCWWNFKTLPNVTEVTPSYMDFIIKSEDSVLHHWMKAGISGWRLDVIDELPEAFSQAFYKELKATNPDAVMIGEVWEDASNKVAYGVEREYLCGQEMDSAMNYPFRAILFDYLLGKDDAEMSSRRFKSLRENYPKENYYAMMNLIGSHDSMRAITVLGEAAYYDGMPAIEQSRARLATEQYNLGMARLILAATMQMTYPGVPCVYYGDEVGMQGFKDPYNRRPYRWKRGDEYIKGIYKKLIALRNEHISLRTGEILPLYAKGPVLAYSRFIRSGRDVFGRAADDDGFIVVFNRDRKEKAEIELIVGEVTSGVFQDALQAEGRADEYSAKAGVLTLTIPPLKALVLKEKKREPKFKRQAGVLLHPTSLPSKFGIGGFGKEAFEFIDFLASAGQSVWQILPLGPVDYGYSPYSSPSAFAGNTLLIDIDDLVARGLITEHEVRVPYSTSDTVDFDRVRALKEKPLKAAFQKFKKTAKKNKVYQDFLAHESYWLDDYALFVAIKAEQKGECWVNWPEPLRERDYKSLGVMRSCLEDEVEYQKFTQFIFHSQWKRVHDYARQKGVQILGDMPIFISQDSADAWANQKLFDLAEDGTARTVAGVPPDYFSATGQLWGNPQYNWEAMKKEDYGWWKKRFKKLYEMVDIVRVDHFRAFESYWEIPGGAKTAIEGRWLKGPGKPFFDKLKKEFGGSLAIVAEDLGIITEKVERLRDDCGFPGMKVLHFVLNLSGSGQTGFAAPENSVVYTGTHDNNTTVGWYKHDLGDAERAALAKLLGERRADPKRITVRLVEMAYASAARLAIIPMQDLLQLDERSRMNTPGTVGHNWKWCLREDYLDSLDVAHLRSLAEHCRRI